MPCTTICKENLNWCIRLFGLGNLDNSVTGFFMFLVCYWMLYRLLFVPHDFTEDGRVNPNFEVLMDEVDLELLRYFEKLGCL